VGVLSDVDPFVKIQALANGIGAARNADVLLYNGAIRREDSDRVIELCGGRQLRENVFLILTTSGGDPHAAYRIARCLQHHYKRFVAFVPGYCKSAGTLLVLGANELVMSRHAELGPLDLQVSREDEVGDRSSVLTPTDALLVLQSQALGAATMFFDGLRRRARLPTKLAADVTSALVAGLYKEVFGQIDPMRLGEMERASRIAVEYGKRLVQHGKNVGDETLATLVAGYPSHRFVIDITEARNLFTKVSEPSTQEVAFAMRDPLSDESAIVVFANDPLNSKGDQPNDPAAGPNDGAASRVGG
jgi:hypothetical protein